MVTDLIRQRKSVRTFDGQPLGVEDRSALETYTASPTNGHSTPSHLQRLYCEIDDQAQKWIRGNG